MRDKRQTTFVAISEGGDWSDACVTHLYVPLSVNLDDEHEEYEFWYRHEYIPGLHDSCRRIDFMSWETWLKVKVGARELGDDEIYLWGP
jgi:hypothetical protein